MLPASFLLMAVLAAQTPTGFSFTLQGQVTTDTKESIVRLVLEDPKARGAEVAQTQAYGEGNYEFRALSGRSYRRAQAQR